jgi:hypothetical protein
MKGDSSFLVFLAIALLEEKTRNQRPTLHFLTKIRHRVLSEPVRRRDTPFRSTGKSAQKDEFRDENWISARALGVAVGRSV